MQFDAGELFLFWSFVFWSFEFVSIFGFRASDLFVVRHLRLDAALGSRPKAKLIALLSSPG
jgi:hypothetical protein